MDPLTPTEAEPLPTPSTSHTALATGLHLSDTQTWGHSPLPVNSSEWRSLCAKILIRKNRICASCSYMSPHRNGDASNNDPSNQSTHCPPCEAIWHCGFAGMNGWLQLARSDMDQVEIVRRTRKMFEETGTVPHIRDVDPLATCTDMRTIDLANRLMTTNRGDLSAEENCLRGFFTGRARELFAITMADEPPPDRLAQAQPLNPLDARSLEILTVEKPLPWMIFSPETHSTLHEFFNNWSPSATSQSQVAWICVNNGRPQPADGDNGSIDRSGLDKAWNDICTNRQPVIADLDELARRFDMLSGKWLVFAQHAEVDSLWRCIASATHAGTLGASAKVAPRSDSDSHVICVFTRDYTDVSDVNEVRNGLRRLGVRGIIGYKPDIYTRCRVYKDNPWGISPTRYHQ